MKIERFGKDANDKDCSEGYYAVNARGVLILMPPTSEMADGLRLATADEVARGGDRQACAADVRDYDPTPSDRGV